MLKNKLKENPNDAITRHKEKQHEKYMAYWEMANENLEKFMNDGHYNVIKSNCDGKTIACYYDFVVAFRNEHNYCGPVINTESLRNKLVRLFEVINEKTGF